MLLVLARVQEEYCAKRKVVGILLTLKTSPQSTKECVGKSDAEILVRSVISLYEGAKTRIRVI